MLSHYGRIGIPVEKYKKVNLSQLRYNTRSKPHKRSGRKRPRPGTRMRLYTQLCYIDDQFQFRSIFLLIIGDYDVVPAPDSIQKNRDNSAVVTMSNSQSVQGTSASSQTAKSFSQPIQASLSDPAARSTGTGLDECTSLSSTFSFPYITVIFRWCASRRCD